MKTIWKYTLEAEDTQTILMPEGAQLLCVQSQKGQPCLWALIEEQNKLLVPRKIIIHGTGHRADDANAVNYVGTFQLRDGLLVFHVFDGGEVSSRCGGMVPQRFLPRSR